MWPAGGRKTEKEKGRKEEKKEVHSYLLFVDKPCLVCQQFTVDLVSHSGVSSSLLVIVIRASFIVLYKLYLLFKHNS